MKEKGKGSKLRKETVRWEKKNRRAAGGKKRKTPQAVKECKNVGLARGNRSTREERRARLAAVVRKENV